MKINNKEEIKEILNMNIDDREKRNKIANLKNITTHAMRIIEVRDELELEIGQEWDNLNEPTSWADVNKVGAAFVPETDNDTRYILEVEEVKGYEVQYFEKGISDEEDDLAFDEVYEELMSLLGSDGSMKDESEILVPAETKMIITEISDERDETGYIYIKLEVQK